MIQPLEVSGFEGGCTHTLGFVNLELTVGSIRAVHRFHDIDAQRPTTFYLDELGSIDIKLSFYVSSVPESYLES